MEIVALAILQVRGQPEFFIPSSCGRCYRLGPTRLSRIFLLRTASSWSKSLRMSFNPARFFTSTVALLAVLSWFTATHHCLLGVVRDAQSPAVSACHCPDHCQDTSGHEKGRMLACCQGILSFAPEFAQNKVKFTPIALGFQLAGVDRIVHFGALQTVDVDTEYDTGPPRENCFLETVLKRSLPENAPPVAA